MDFRGQGRAALSKQEYWSGLPCPPPGNLPDPGIEPRSPALQADSLLSEPPGKGGGNLPGVISGLQSPSAVILEPKKIKSVIASTFSPSICHDLMELDARGL